VKILDASYRRTVVTTGIKPDTEKLIPRCPNDCDVTCAIFAGQRPNKPRSQRNDWHAIRTFPNFLVNWIAECRDDGGDISFTWARCEVLTALKMTRSVLWRLVHLQADTDVSEQHSALFQAEIYLRVYTASQAERTMPSAWVFSVVFCAESANQSDAMFLTDASQWPTEANKKAGSPYLVFNYSWRVANRRTITANLLRLI
jgi:hypothetical protein